jgi:hypothetical protein
VPRLRVSNGYSSDLDGLAALKSIEDDFATFTDQTFASPFPTVVPLADTVTRLSAPFGTCGVSPFQPKP